MMMNRAQSLPLPSTEPEQSLETLLYDLYDGCQPRHYSIETESWTDNSVFSDLNLRRAHRHSADSLRQTTVVELRRLRWSLAREANETSQHLVRHLKRRDHQLSRAQAKCNVVTAVLHAFSPKRSVDAKLHFSLDPPATESGFDQWLNAMRAVARLPDGIPHHFRRKLWLTLAQHHVQETAVDWEETRRVAFNERLNPDDDKLGMQIIKDLHRTGWSGLHGEQERVLLKRVLLAYARYNKQIGYCQGFNVIAALVLDVTDFREEVALKMMIFLIEHVLPSGYFDQTLRALSVDMAVLRDLLHQRLPKMAAHLDDLQQNSESEYEPPLTNVFTMQWFLTLFATCLPRRAVFRVWDSLMLEGSEVLLRTALAIWAKISRRVCRTKTADEFYGLMGPLCQELLQMSAAECNDLMQVIYSMAEFPYAGVAELRERYTWNIQPFSSTFKLLRQQVSSILHADADDSADERDPTCMASILPSGDKLCSSGRAAAAADMTALRKQYRLTKQRQKQAAVILQNAYDNRQKRQLMATNDNRLWPPMSAETETFNHLYIDRKRPVRAFSALNGTLPVSPKVVQPSGRTFRSRAINDVPPPPPRRDSTMAASSTAPDDSLSQHSDTLTGRFSSASSLTELACHCLRDASPEPRQRSRSLEAWRDRRADNWTEGRRTSSTVRLARADDSPARSTTPTPRAFADTIHTSTPPPSPPSPPLPRTPAVGPLYYTTPSEGPAPRSAARSTGSSSKAMLNKSRAMLSAIKADATRPTFNPFPTRHTTRLIEREKQFGLY